MLVKVYKNYRITADIHNRLENYCAVNWEIMEKTRNGWQGIKAFTERINRDITDEEALEFGLQSAKKYIDENY